MRVHNSLASFFKEQNRKHYIIILLKTEKNEANSMFRVVFTTLAFIGALFKIFVIKAPPAEAFLFNLILFNIGFWGTFAFLEHYFRFNKAMAEAIWQPTGIFKNTVIFLNLLRGIFGILCIWFRGNFWWVTVLISSVFLFSYGCYELKHVEEMVVKDSEPSNYTDCVLSFDLIFPVAFIILMAVYKMAI